MACAEAPPRQTTPNAAQRCSRCSNSEECPAPGASGTRYAACTHPTSLAGTPASQERLSQEADSPAVREVGHESGVKSRLEPVAWQSLVSAALYAIGSRCAADRSTGSSTRSTVPPTPSAHTQLSRSRRRAKAGTAAQTAGGERKEPPPTNPHPRPCATCGAAYRLRPQTGCTSAAAPRQLCDPPVGPKRP